MHFDYGQIYRFFGIKINSKSNLQISDCPDLNEKFHEQPEILDIIGQGVKESEN